jgi:NAD(P)H dehydrogenase (quinone)
MKVLVTFYSMYGHLFRMANAVAEGAGRIAGAEVTIKRIPETLPEAVLEKMGAVAAQKAFAHVEPVTLDDLSAAQAVIFGVPTRFGGVPAQVQQVLDSTGGLWQQGALIGKVGGVFTSSATQHGGQETTIRHMHTMMLHQGFVIAGLPYSFQGQMGVTEITGCSPYGASTIAGGQGERMPSENELEGARHQGEYIATLASKLAAG